MLDRMKLSTHQYARSQIKWIRKQLLPAVKEARRQGGEVEVYVMKGGREGHEPAVRLLNGESAAMGIDTWKTTWLRLTASAFLSDSKGDMPDGEIVGHPDSAELLADLYETRTSGGVPNIEQ